MLEINDGMTVAPGSLYERLPRRDFGEAVLRVAVLASALMIAVFLTACRVGPSFRPVKSPMAEKWKATSDQRIKGEPVDSREWWKAFNDQTLNGLIQQAYEQNLDLQAAGLRIIQSRLARATSVWTLFPAGQVSGQAVHTRMSQNVSPDVNIKKKDSAKFDNILTDALKQKITGALPDISVTPELDIYKAGLDAIWELDVWGKTRRKIEAGSGELSASIADYDNILVSLSGEVAALYIDIRTIQQQLRIAHENIAILQNVTGVVQKRRSKNIVTDLDVDLAGTVLRDVQASVPALEAALSQAENALCVLLGKAPYDIAKELGDSTRIPIASKDIAIGAPADLLRRRPDVRGAEHLAAAQCARIGQAKASLYPSFTLLGSLGLQSSKSNMFFKDDSVRGAYGGMFSWNILLYPVIQDAVRAQDAKFHEAVAFYKSTVLNAAREVETAATAFVKAQDRLPLLTENADASQRAIRRASEQYEMGVTPFVTVVNSAQFLVQERDRAAQAQGQVALALVATYKALGGGWEIREGKEVIPEETKKQMRKETDWWSIEGPRMLTTKKLLAPK